MVYRNLSVFLKVGLFTIIFSALSACNNGGSSGLPGAQPVDTPPQVSSTTPASNAIDGVPGIITVVFSENVNGINKNTFLVKLTDTAAELTGVVTYDSASLTATFTNTSDKLMLFNTNYTVTLKSDVILDDTDNPLDSVDYIYSFETGDTPIVDISTRLVGDISQHFLAVDDNGRAASVWKQQDSNNVRIYASLFENGKWQPATTLLVIPILASTSVSIKGLVSNGSGFAAQWNRKDQAGEANNNHVSIYTDNVDGGGSWTGQDSAINTGAGDASELLLATNGNGYVTVWLQPISIRSSMIRSRFYTSTWSAIVDVAPVVVTYPELQLTSNGSGYGLVWLDLGMNNGDTVEVVNFDFYDGSWNNSANIKPTRVSLPFTELEGMLFESYRPRISSNGLFYALTWYGNDVDDKSRIFSAVMTDVTLDTRTILWNGPLRLTTIFNPSNNNIVASGNGYLVTWDAYDISATADSYIYYSPFIPDLTCPCKGDWYPQQGPANDTNDGTAASPLPFGTSSGYAIVWAQTGTGTNDGDVAGRVKLNGVWQIAALLSNKSLGKESGLTINGAGDKFIAAWAQGPATLVPADSIPITYVNRYDGTTWESKPVALDPLAVTTKSSDVKTVPLGNGHYMVTWLKEVTLGGAKRLDSKFVQAP